jgi:hypothetical protein
VTFTSPDCPALEGAFETTGAGAAGSCGGRDSNSEVIGVGWDALSGRASLVMYFMMLCVAASVQPEGWRSNTKKRLDRRDGWLRLGLCGVVLCCRGSSLQGQETYIGDVGGG